jgi:hypothetical protein
MATASTTEMTTTIKLGDRVKFYFRGTAYWGRVLKINRKTFLVSDEKGGSTHQYQVAQSLCRLIPGV